MMKTGILVIDDDDGVRNMICRWLRSQGMAVWEADGGEAGVKLFRRHRAEIGLVLLDVIMAPLDGPATLRQLKLIDDNLKACFITADAGQYSESDLLDLGAKEVFQKGNIVLQELAETLQNYIHGEDDAQES